MHTINCKKRICDPGPQTSLKSLGYICSNSQKYTLWVKIIDLSLKIIRTLVKIMFYEDIL